MRHVGDEGDGPEQVRADALKHETRGYTEGDGPEQVGTDALQHEKHLNSEGDGSDCTCT